MNWNELYDIIDSNQFDNYILIDDTNIELLEKGNHVKYLKDNKLYNGGFLIKIIDYNPKKLINTFLVLKSNIIWKLRFNKYKIYVKKKENKIDSLKELYNHEIKKINSNYTNNINIKLDIIKNNKNNYNIII